VLNLGANLSLPGNGDSLDVEGTGSNVNGKGFGITAHLVPRHSQQKRGELFRTPDLVLTECRPDKKLAITDWQMSDGSLPRRIDSIFMKPRATRFTCGA
jgi:hypothetical protein